MKRGCSKKTKKKKQKKEEKEEREKRVRTMIFFHEAVIIEKEKTKKEKRVIMVTEVNIYTSLGLALGLLMLSIRLGISLYQAS